MKAIWTLICRIFTRDRIAKVWKILFDGAITGVVSVLTNQALMDAAFQISLSILGLKDLTTGEGKAALFDRMFCEWCFDHARPIPARAELNAIREIAYAAVRSQVEAQDRSLLIGK